MCKVSHHHIKKITQSETPGCRKSSGGSENPCLQGIFKGEAWQYMNGRNCSKRSAKSPGVMLPNLK